MGVPVNEFDLAELKQDPGELQDKRWLSIAWKKPERETIQSWWLVNPTEVDKSKPPVFACRSLACLTLELKQSKCATSVKLRKAYDNRSQENAAAVDILRKNRLWKRLGGPNAETLFNPTRGALDRCGQCVTALDELQERSDIIDDAFAAEVRKAVSMLKSLAWSDIYKERFPLTPPGLYTELVRNAEAFLNKNAEEQIRREAWLARDVGSDDRGAVALGRRTFDKYGLDLDEFKQKSGKKPRDWKKCLLFAQSSRA